MALRKKPIRREFLRKRINILPPIVNHEVISFKRRVDRKIRNIKKYKLKLIKRKRPSKALRRVIKRIYKANQKEIAQLFAKKMKNFKNNTKSPTETRVILTSSAPYDLDPRDPTTDVPLVHRLLALKAEQFVKYVEKKKFKVKKNSIVPLALKYKRNLKITNLVAKAKKLVKLYSFKKRRKFRRAKKPKYRKYFFPKLPKNVAAFYPAISMTA